MGDIYFRLVTFSWFSNFALLSALFFWRPHLHIIKMELTLNYSITNVNEDKGVKSFELFTYDYEVNVDMSLAKAIDSTANKSSRIF